MRTKAELRIVGASAAHVGRVAHRLRAMDREEIVAKGRDIKSALRLSLASSSWACTATLDGVPHAMFGVCALSLVEDRGRPWFLGSDEVYRHGREMLLYGLHFVDKMHESFRRLENVVSRDNVQAIRLLKRWGFTVDDDVTIAGGVPFVSFWREARDV